MSEGLAVDARSSLTTEDRAAGDSATTKGTVTDNHPYDFSSTTNRP